MTYVEHPRYGNRPRCTTLATPEPKPGLRRHGLDLIEAGSSTGGKRGACGRAAKIEQEKEA